MSAQNSQFSQSVALYISQRDALLSYIQTLPLNDKPAVYTANPVKGKNRMDVSFQGEGRGVNEYFIISPENITYSDLEQDIRNLMTFTAFVIDEQKGGSSNERNIYNHLIALFTKLSVNFIENSLHNSVIDLCKHELAVNTQILYDITKQ